MRILLDKCVPRPPGQSSPSRRWWPSVSRSARPWPRARRNIPQSDSLPIEGLLPSPSREAGPSGIKLPILERDKVVRKLPSTVADVAVGGGRYLILHLPAARKLAVFDVNAAEIVSHIPLAEEGAKFAAGLEHVLVLLPTARTIERWSLQTCQREVVADLPIKGAIKAVSMGSASKGPLLIHWAMGTQPLDRAAFLLFNVETMKAVEREIKVAPMMGAFFRDGKRVLFGSNDWVHKLTGGPPVLRKRPCALSFLHCLTLS